MDVDAIMKQLTKEDITKLQSLVEQAKENPQLQQYVYQHKFRLIDQRLVVVDILLDKGILK